MYARTFVAFAFAASLLGSPALAQRSGTPAPPVPPSGMSFEQALSCAAQFERLVPQDVTDSDGALMGLLASRALEDAERLAPDAAARAGIDAEVASRRSALSAAVDGATRQRGMEADFRACFAAYAR
jgi:hypothetical protein